MFRQAKDLCESCKYYDRDERECPYHFIDDDCDATIECDEYEEARKYNKQKKLKREHEEEG